MMRSMPYSIMRAAAILMALLFMAGIEAGAASVPKTFTEADNGSLAVIKKGETFMVVLAENPSTGYSWNMTISDGLKVLGDRYIPPAQQIPGRGGQHEWTIQAVKPGQQKVRGIYKRPWEPLYYNETTFRLDLEVTGSLASNIFPDLSGNAFDIRDMLGNLGSMDFSPPAIHMLPSLHFNFKGFLQF